MLERITCDTSYLYGIVNDIKCIHRIYVGYEMISSAYIVMDMNQERITCDITSCDACNM